MYGAPREYSEIPTSLDELNLGRVIKIKKIKSKKLFIDLNKKE